MINLQGLYVLAWSQRKNDLHIGPLADVMSWNRSDYTDDKAGDYRPLMVGPEVEMRRAADAMRPTINARRVNLPLGVTA